MSIRRTHTDNPQHPAAIVGFAIFLIGFGAAPLALTALAFGSGTAALVAAIVAVIGMAIGIGIVSAMTRRLQHSRAATGCDVERGAALPGGLPPPGRLA
ncbi:hypothetical protein RND64_14810 [Gordonia sp. w5E2]|uniref:hypothetical protein n=1 Tax=Gordonia sp. w5E2 TaxID=3075837 RepID=UPI002F42F91B